MPQGTLPVLEVEGKKIGQSQAIMRYLGRVHSNYLYLLSNLIKLKFRFDRPQSHRASSCR